MSEARAFAEQWLVWMLAILMVLGVGRLGARSERWKWAMGMLVFLLAIVGVQALLWRMLG